MITPRRSELQPVRHEMSGEGIITLQLSDDANRNALTPPVVDALSHHLDTIAHDPDVRVCLLRGLHDVFCSGGHRDMLLALASGESSASDIPLLRAVLEIPVPTIAAVEGHAIGGGLMLALCADMVILARESRYGCPFVDMGFTPGAGATSLLEGAVGEYLAAEFLYGGEFVRGARFEGRTGINHVLPRREVWPRALDLAGRIADKPRVTLELLKRRLSLRKRKAFEEARTIESIMHDVCFARPETATLIREEYIPTDAPAPFAGKATPTTPPEREA